MYAGNQFYFKFADGSGLQIHPEMHKLSVTIAEKHKTGQPVTISEQYIAEAFNKFADVFFPKHADQLKNLEYAADKNDWWMELIVSRGVLYEFVITFRCLG
jgi:hypothetical protein